MARRYRHPFLNPYGLPKNSWGYRVFQLRHALGWTQEKLALIMGVSVSGAIVPLESGSVTHPTFETIMSIKSVESMYSDILHEYKKSPIRLSRLPGKEKYGNNRFFKKSTVKLLPIEVRRPENIETLGDVETNSEAIFLGQKTRKLQNRGWNKSDYRRRDRKSKAATRLRHEEAIRRRGEDGVNNPAQPRQPDGKSGH